MIPKIFTAEYNKGKSITFYFDTGHSYACVDGNIPIYGRSQSPFSFVGTFYESYESIEMDYPGWEEEGVVINLEKENPFSDKEMKVVYKAALELVFQ